MGFGNRGIQSEIVGQDPVALAGWFTVASQPLLPGHAGHGHPRFDHLVTEFEFRALALRFGTSFVIVQVEVKAILDEISKAGAVKGPDNGPPSSPAIEGAVCG